MIALAFSIDSDIRNYTHIESNVKKQYLGEPPDYPQRVFNRGSYLDLPAPRAKKYLFVWCQFASGGRLAAILYL
jgi:hypothetical protein